MTDYNKIAQYFMEELDRSRENWFRIAKEYIEEIVDEDGIINNELDEEISIDLKSMPKGYPYNKVNGQCVEAALIGVQTNMAFKYCSNKGYLDPISQQQFIKSWIKHLTPDSIWTVSIGMGAAVEDFNVIRDGVFLCLSHYLINEPEQNPKIDAVFNELKGEPFYLLAILTHLGTSLAFGDEETSKQILSKLGWSG